MFLLNHLGLCHASSHLGFQCEFFFDQLEQGQGRNGSFSGESGDSDVDVTGQDGLPEDIGETGRQDTILKGQVVNDHVGEGPDLGVFHEESSELGLDLLGYDGVVFFGGQENGDGDFPSSNNEGRGEELIEENGEDGAFNGASRVVDIGQQGVGDGVGQMVPAEPNESTAETLEDEALSAGHVMGGLAVLELGNHVTESREKAGGEGGRHEGMRLQQETVLIGQLGEDGGVHLLCGGTGRRRRSGGTVSAAMVLVNVGALPKVAPRLNNGGEGFRRDQPV
jgi:hypothetical protein